MPNALGFPASAQLQSHFPTSERMTAPFPQPTFVRCLDPWGRTSHYQLLVSIYETHKIVPLIDSHVSSHSPSGWNNASRGSCPAVSSLHLGRLFEPCASIYTLMSSVSEWSYSPFLTPPPCDVSHRGSHRISFMMPHISIHFPVKEPLPTESQRVERERGATSVGQSLVNWSEKS